MFFTSYWFCLYRFEKVVKIVKVMQQAYTGTCNYAISESPYWWCWDAKLLAITFSLFIRWISSLFIIFWVKWNYHNKRTQNKHLGMNMIRCSNHDITVCGGMSLALHDQSLQCLYVYACPTKYHSKYLYVYFNKVYKKLHCQPSDVTIHKSFNWGIIQSLCMTYADCHGK